MKSVLILLLGTLFVVPIFAESWTVLVYMAADNNLWQNAVQDVNDMESVEIPDNLDLIVQTDMPADSDYPGGQRRKIHYDTSSAITSNVISNLGGIDSGDPQTLKSFINWGFQHYPAQRKMLIIWGHGDNWFKSDEPKWICPDYNTNNLISVSAGELKDALTVIPALDILLFDACSMQSVEVLSEVMNAADYVVGSEELVPAAGFPYQTIVPLFASGTVEQISEQIPQEYLESYEAGGIQNPNGFTNPTTCSSIKTEMLPGFFTAFRDYFFNGPLYGYPIMLEYRLDYWEMNTGYNDIDMGELLSTYAGWGGGIDELITSWNACVVISGSINIANHQVGSAAIWFPYNRQYYDSWWTHYELLDFSQYRWLSVLNRVYGNSSIAPPSPEVVDKKFILNTLVIDLQQPAYPDSLWYYLVYRHNGSSDPAILITPGFGQDVFSTSVTVYEDGTISLFSVDPWGNVSDSTYFAVDYSEPPLELIVAPNPVHDRYLASVRWYLPEGISGVARLSLYNMRGQKVLEKTFVQDVPGEGIWLLSAEEKFRGLGRGTYIMKLKAGKKEFQQKLTIL